MAKKDIGAMLFGKNPNADTLGALLMSIVTLVLLSAPILYFALSV